MLYHYKAAVNILNEYACQNYSEAQFHLANCYYNGMGVKTNTKKAMSYYKKAADQGHAQAAFYLGVIYQNSNDYQKSAQFYKRSYDLGFVDALAYYNQVSNMIDVNILPPVFSLKSFPGSDPLVPIAISMAIS